MKQKKNAACSMVSVFHRHDLIIDTNISMAILQSFIIIVNL